MDKSQQEELIKNLCKNLQEDMLKHTLPGTWDGFELRWYLVDKANEFVMNDARDKRKSRYRIYTKDKLIYGL